MSITKAKVLKIPNGENVVSLNNKKYQVRFTAKHAEHFCESFDQDSLHDARPRDAVRILKTSIVYKITRKRDKFLCLGRNTTNNFVYEIYVVILENTIDVVTCYKARKDLVKKFEDDEKETR